MAVLRDQPYGNARFQVEIDGVEQDAFAEVLLPELTTPAVEYREGGDREAPARLLPGRPQVGRMVLRRGFRGSLSLHTWYRQVAEGDRGARRDVIVRLFDEGMAAVVATWRLRGAWPTRYVAGPLHALGGAVVMEEVELVGDRFEAE